VTAGERCDPEGVAFVLVASGGSDLSPADVVSRDFLQLDPAVVVAEFDELTTRKPATTTTTTTTTKGTERSYFICY